MQYLLTEEEWKNCQWKNCQWKNCQWKNCQTMREHVCKEEHQKFCDHLEKAITGMDWRFESAQTIIAKLKGAIKNFKEGVPV